METDKKIYIVTSGEYSDYMIEAVFSTKEKAYEYVDQRGSDFRIEEFPIDSYVPDTSKKKWNIYLDYNTGELVRCNLSDGVLFNRDYFYYAKPIFSSGFLNFNIEAESVSKAVKIASEMFMQVKALENIKFPLLRKECIAGKRIHKYPTYNFRSGAVVLDHMEQLLSCWSAPIERGEHQ